MTSKELSRIYVREVLSSEFLQAKARGILHGVPVLVKDNMATKDKMETTAGSWALLGSIVRVRSKRCFLSEEYRGRDLSSCTSRTSVLILFQITKILLRQD